MFGPIHFPGIIHTRSGVCPVPAAGVTDPPGDAPHYSARPTDRSGHREPCARARASTDTCACARRRVLQKRKEGRRFAGDGQCVLLFTELLLVRATSQQIAVRVTALYL